MLRKKVQPVHEIKVRREKRSPRDLKKNFTKTEYYATKLQQDFTRAGSYDPRVENVVQWSKVGGTQKRLFGSNIPGWRSLIERGLPATTSAEGVRTNQRSLGYFDWLLKHTETIPSPYTETIRLSGYDIGSIPTASLFIEPRDDDDAKASFIRNARKIQSSALGGEFIRDLGRTLGSFGKVRDLFLRSLLRHTTSQASLRRQLLGLEKTKHYRRRDTVKALSQNWLEYSYGIAPTVSDLQGLGQAVGRAYGRSRFGVDSQRCRGFSRRFRTTQSTYALGPPGLYAPNNMRITATVTNVYEDYVAYYGGVRTLTSDSFTSNVIEDVGLGVRSFIPTLWELVPYSFLVDYFTNTGAIVSALSFPRSDILWLNKLIRNSVTSTIQYKERLLFPFNGVITANTFDTKPLIFSQVAFSRTLYNGSLVPTFRLHLPYRGSAWVNILALIGSKI